MASSWNPQHYPDICDAIDVTCICLRYSYIPNTVQYHNVKLLFIYIIYIASSCFLLYYISFVLFIYSTQLKLRYLIF